MSVEVTCTGFDFLDRYIETISDAQFMNAQRRSMTKACQPVVRAMKSLNTDESGAMELSITTKVKGFKKNRTVYGIVGPESGVAFSYKGRKRIPAKYAHLVERGHRIARGGKLERKVTSKSGKVYFYPADAGARHAGDVTAYPFIEPAYEAEKETAERIFHDEFVRMIVNAADRAAKKAAKEKAV